jgi:hypothetical protein
MANGFINTDMPGSSWVSALAWRCSAITPAVVKQGQLWSPHDKGGNSRRKHERIAHAGGSGQAAGSPNGEVPQSCANIAPPMLPDGERSKLGVA